MNHFDERIKKHYLKHNVEDIGSDTLVSELPEANGRTAVKLNALNIGVLHSDDSEDGYHYCHRTWDKLTWKRKDGSTYETTGEKE